VPEEKRLLVPTWAEHCPPAGRVAHSRNSSRSRPGSDWKRPRRERLQQRQTDRQWDPRWHPPRRLERCSPRPRTRETALHPSRPAPRWGRTPPAQLPAAPVVPICARGNPVSRCGFSHNQARRCSRRVLILPPVPHRAPRGRPTGPG
jgi:hypothetical protein